VLDAAQKAVSTVSSLIKREKLQNLLKTFHFKSQEELAQVAINLDQARKYSSDDRFPVMVILSIRAGLEKQFGKQTMAVIDTELKSLSVSIDDYLNGVPVYLCR
jgi:hypothetical protein